MTAGVSGQMKGGLITRDLLGGCFGNESKELDLDLHVPSGWEKHLDLKSGKVFIQRHNPTNSTSDQSNLIAQSSSLSSSITTSPPPTPTLNLFQDKTMELNPLQYSNYYTSVCTLDKVKSALERVVVVVETTTKATLSSSSFSFSSSSPKKRGMVSSPSPSSSSNSSSVKQGDDDQNGLVVAACSNCLLYVLVTKFDPKCPQCNSVIEWPSVTKKPKFDLNMSI